MILKIRENSVLTDKLKLDLEEEFRENYKIKKFSKNRITMAKGKITGAIVTVKKDSIIVVGNFPNPFIYGAYVFLMVFTGILIPFMLYMFFFDKKMKQCGKEVSEYVLKNYGHQIIY